MADDPRLQRIEDRLDKIGDAIERIARTEERVLSIMNFVNRLDSRLENVEQDMKEIKTLAIQNERAHKSNDWFFKTLFTAVVSAMCAAAAMRYFT
jgi:DNA repair exonuclease SbcCD ATPase subunit